MPLGTSGRISHMGITVALATLVSVATGGISARSQVKRQWQVPHSTLDGSNIQNITLESSGREHEL